MYTPHSAIPESCDVSIVQTDMEKVLNDYCHNKVRFANAVHRNWMNRPFLLEDNNVMNIFWDFAGTIKGEFWSPPTVKLSSTIRGICLLSNG